MQEVFRNRLAKLPIGFVERKMLIQHHSFGTNEPQPDQEWLNVAKLEVVQRLGDLGRLALSSRRRLELVDLPGQNISAFSSDDGQGVGRGLQHVDQC